jgi:DNA-binding MarR family transcriptional regulator
MSPRNPSASPSKALLLDHQLCFALYSASLSMTKLYKPLLEELGLTYPQYLVMLVLWETDGVSVGTLIERLFLDSGTLTPLLKRMEQAQLLTRRRSEQDERRVEVTLTAQGRKLQQRAAAVPPCVLEAAACPVPELMTLTREVQALRDRIIAASA